MELRDLEYFAVIAEHRHLGRAAEALGLSTPALSKSLRRLEQAVRAKLVARNPKGVELTPAGSALLHRARGLRLALEDVEREAAALGTGDSGELRIGAAPGFAEFLLPSAMARLLRQTRNVTLSVSVGDSAAALLPALRKGELDLVFGAFASPSLSGLVREGLYEDDYVVYVSARHRLAGRKRLMLAELARERWAMANRYTPLSQRLRQTFEERGLPAPTIVLVSNSVLLRLRSVGGSELLNLGSKRFLLQSAPRSDYAILPVPELTWHCTVGVTYREDGYLPPAGRRFIQILKETAQEIAPQ